MNFFMHLSERARKLVVKKLCAKQAITVFLSQLAFSKGFSSSSISAIKNTNGSRSPFGSKHYTLRCNFEHFFCHFALDNFISRFCTSLQIYKHLRFFWLKLVILWLSC